MSTPDDPEAPAEPGPGEISAQIQNPLRRTPSVKDVLILYLLVLAYMMYAGYLSGSFPEENSLPSSVASMLFSAGFAVIPLVYSLIRKFDLRQTFPVKLPSIKETAGGIVLITGILVLILFLLVIISFFFPDAEDVSEELLPTILGGNIWTALLSIAVFPAVCEEILCRGFFLSGLRGTGKKKTALVICAFMFALLHADPVRIPVPFISGLAITWAAWETGSLAVPVIMHFFNNFLTLMFARLVMGQAGNSDIENSQAVIEELSPALEQTANAISAVIYIWFLCLGLVCIHAGIALIKEKRPGRKQQQFSCAE
ncbi:CPBP family intramembrane metalloprotease [Brucepastera parasyntrophica]|uniref:CPBP family intramembrane glutamic endopeptidase n=1 Tax=Brucepastera parasyntrophica TaxID=2880008 RepID=UPI0021087DBC|nr:type II CAAX endopeptidase family protein [Brucepastera parasyntrophica]ULQ58953.1 CPBP family intramembrane metalloprotease [Brucepastera parasyntrophica]